MAKREMVSLRLYEDGKYEVVDACSDLATYHFFGVKDGKNCEGWVCKKTMWKHYLLKLLSTKQIDKEIAELKKRKKNIIELKERILKEQTNEDSN